MLNKLDHIIHMPGLTQIKDIHSNFVCTSDDFAKFVGWKSGKECEGKTDYDMPCKAVEFASEFIKMDKKVVSTQKKLVTVDIQHYVSNWKILLAEKSPIISEEGKTIGVFNHATDVTKFNLFRIYMIINRLDAKLFGKDSLPMSYQLSSKEHAFSLTEKQENCLFLLLRGKTVREIGKMLGKSPRTIEGHLEAIKNKLMCQSKADIIEKAIDSGFLSYIPKSLQGNQYGNVEKWFE